MNLHPSHRLQDKVYGKARGRRLYRSYADDRHRQPISIVKPETPIFRKSARKIVSLHPGHRLQVKDFGEARGRRLYRFI
ncbi:MAG: hypothetical protein WAM73_10145, partial [Desulfobacterales bacterium]